MQPSSVGSHTPLTKSWKIWIPLSLVLGVITALIVVFISMSVKNPVELSLWAIVAMVLLISITLISSSICLILIIFSSLATRSLHQKTASVIASVQKHATRINQTLRVTSDAVVKPIIWTNEISAALRVILKNRKRS